jgi:K+-transporting ATPase ATPase C chain
MNITKNLIVAVLMTLVTTVLLGLVYPLVVTGVAQVLFPGTANGQLIERDGKIIWIADHRPGVLVTRLLPSSAAGAAYTMRPTPRARTWGRPTRS